MAEVSKMISYYFRGTSAGLLTLLFLSSMVAPTFLSISPVSTAVPTQAVETLSGAVGKSGFLAELGGLKNVGLPGEAVIAGGAAVLASVLTAEPAAAAPAVPGELWAGGDPTNLIWINATPEDVRRLMLNLGWEQAQGWTHGAYAQLQFPKGGIFRYLTNRYHLRVYYGGWDPDWGHWCYGGVHHEEFDINLFDGTPAPDHVVNDWEGAEDQVRGQAGGSTLVEWAREDHNLGNSGYYNGVWNDGMATVIKLKSPALATPVYTYTYTFENISHNWKPSLFGVNDLLNIMPELNLNEVRDLMVDAVIEDTGQRTLWISGEIWTELESIHTWVSIALHSETCADVWVEYGPDYTIEGRYVRGPLPIPEGWPGVTFEIPGVDAGLGSEFPFKVAIRPHNPQETFAISVQIRSSGPPTLKLAEAIASTIATKGLSKVFGGAVAATKMGQIISTLSDLWIVDAVKLAIKAHTGWEIYTSLLPNGIFFTSNWRFEDGSEHVVGDTYDYNSGYEGPYPYDMFHNPLNVWLEDSVYYINSTDYNYDFYEFYAREGDYISIYVEFHDIITEDWVTLLSPDYTHFITSFNSWDSETARVWDGHIHENYFNNVNWRRYYIDSGVTGSIGPFDYIYFQEGISNGTNTVYLMVVAPATGTWTAGIMTHWINTGNEKPYDLFLDVTPTDITPPGSGIWINGGAEETTNPEVKLDLRVSDPESPAIAMCFSNDGIHWTPWEPFYTPKYWTLAGGAGQKTVYVKFMNRSGIESENSDSIMFLGEEGGDPPNDLGLGIDAGSNVTTAAVYPFAPYPDDLLLKPREDWLEGHASAPFDNIDLYKIWAVPSEYLYIDFTAPSDAGFSVAIYDSLGGVKAAEFVPAGEIKTISYGPIPITWVKAIDYHYFIELIPFDPSTGERAPSNDNYKIKVRIVTTDTTTPDATIEINDGALHMPTKSVVLDLAFTDLESLFGIVCVRNEFESYGSWEAIPPGTIAISRLIKFWEIRAEPSVTSPITHVYAKFKNRAGHTSEIWVSLALVPFSWTPFNPQAGETVRFDASLASSCYGRDIVSYSWDFGDGVKVGGPVERAEFEPNADAYVLSSVPDMNFGNEYSIKVMTAAPSLLEPLERWSSWSYLSFDLSNIPTDVIVHSAVLRLYASDNDVIGTVPLPRIYDLYQITSAWEESTITWNNKPSVAASPSSDTPISDIYTYYYWDITSLVRGWISGSTPNYGVMLRDRETLTEPVSLVEFSFVSRDWSGHEEAPRLVVVYSPPGSTEVQTHTFTDNDTYAVTLMVYDDHGTMIDNLSLAILVGSLGINHADIVQDGKIDIKDVVYPAYSFGTCPGHWRWDALADVNADCKVDIKDIAIVASEFGWVG
jgi:hypothetical protein